MAAGEHVDIRSLTDFGVVESACIKLHAHRDRLQKDSANIFLYATYDVFQLCLLLVYGCWRAPGASRDSRCYSWP